MKTLQVRSIRPIEMIDISADVCKVIREAGVTMVFSLRETAAAGKAWSYGPSMKAGKQPGNATVI